MYCCALSSVEVLDFFSEAIDKSGVNNACFLLKFSDNRFFLAFVRLNVAFYKVPVTSAITKQKIFYLAAFQKYDGPAGFLAKQMPSPNPLFVLHIIYRGNLKVICKFTNA